jgi:FkbM family methyltransferase
MIDNQHLWQKPVKTPMGFLMVGNKGMMNGKFEPEETALVHKLLQDADLFINVGANIGYYSCLALREGKMTVAVEPMHRNVRCLCRNITLNGWEDRVEVYPMALGDRPGLVEIYGGGTVASLVKGWSGTPTSYRQWIPVTTLDALFAPRFAGKRCLVLVDVEGAELGMLRGAPEFLHRSPSPVWMVEIAIDEHLPDGLKVNPNLLETFSIFWEAGYDSFTADQTRRRVLPSEIEAIIATGRNTLATHNFIFRRSADT